MDTDYSRSSSEDSSENMLLDETVQEIHFDLCEKSGSNPDGDNSRHGISDENQNSSSGLSEIDDYLKSFARHSRRRTADVSSENLQRTDKESPLSTDESKIPDEKAEKFERNLEKFMKEREPLKELQLRKKTEISARQRKSDGEMAKIIEYCNEVLKLSSTAAQRSSAPPTFSNEMEPKQKSQTEKLFCFESTKRKSMSKEIAHPKNFSASAAETGISYPTTAQDLRLSKISAFKVPISPTQKTPDNSAKAIQTGEKKDPATPVQRRPTHFDGRPRKAFYTFSPGSSSPGVLRQCRSLPNIYKPRQKDQMQRRSINLGEHSRIVRSLFRDNPEPVTPESKVSTFYKSTRSMEESESSESNPEVPKASQNLPPLICRKLVFVSSSKEPANSSQITLVDKISCVAEVLKTTSPEKEVPKTVQKQSSNACRKLDFGCSSKEKEHHDAKAVVKKASCVAAVLKSNSPEKDEQMEAPKTLLSKPTKVLSLAIDSITKEKANKSQQFEKSSDAESPSKRKNPNPVEADCHISAKKLRASSGTEVEETGNNKNEMKNVCSVDVECSISAKKVRTSLETQMEEGGGELTAKKRTSSGSKMEETVETVRKNESSDDAECSITAKKVKTSSEIKIQESGSEEYEEK